MFLVVCMYYLLFMFFLCVCVSSFRENLCLSLCLLPLQFFCLSVSLPSPFAVFLLVCLFAFSVCSLSACLSLCLLRLQSFCLPVTLPSPFAVFLLACHFAFSVCSFSACLSLCLLRYFLLACHFLSVGLESCASFDDGNCYIRCLLVESGKHNIAYVYLDRAVCKL